MENIDIGMLPSIEFEDKINYLFESPNKALIAVGVGKSIFIYDKS